MRKQIMLVVVIAVAVLVLFIMPASAQNKESPSQSEIAALKKEIARLQSELDTCQKAKDEATNTRRSDAIASLNAIRSALGTGANLQEFKKYQIESRIKIDALPNTPENQVIKDISDLYRDAVTFGIIGLTGTVSDYELAAAQKRYNGDADLMKFIGDMKPNNSPRGLTHDLNRVDAKAISQLLVLIAGKKFSELK